MLNKIILDGALVDDNWTLVTDAEAALPAGNIIVPLSLYNAKRSELLQRADALGLWLESDESPQLIEGDLSELALIAINFPAFTDGRGFSYARELRDTHGYQGQVRAIGGFMRDQLHFLKRCGFNAFALGSQQLGSEQLESALASLNDFSEFYQADTQEKQPLFRRL